LICFKKFALRVGNGPWKKGERKERKGGHESFSGVIVMGKQHVKIEGILRLENKRCVLVCPNRKNGSTTKRNSFNGSQIDER
jgi:hypothetical protein